MKGPENPFSAGLSKVVLLSTPGLLEVNVFLLSVYEGNGNMSCGILKFFSTTYPIGSPLL